MNESDFTAAELHALRHPPERTAEERARRRGEVALLMREHCSSETVLRFLACHPNTVILPGAFAHYQIALDVLSKLGYRSKPGAHDDQKENED